MSRQTVTRCVAVMIATGLLLAETARAQPGPPPMIRPPMGPPRMPGPPMRPNFRPPAARPNFTPPASRPPNIGPSAGRPPLTPNIAQKPVLPGPGQIGSGPPGSGNAWVPPGSTSGFNLQNIPGQFQPGQNRPNDFASALASAARTHGAPSNWDDFTKSIANDASNYSGQGKWDDAAKSIANDARDYYRENRWKDVARDIANAYSQYGFYPYESYPYYYGYYPSSDSGSGYASGGSGDSGYGSGDYSGQTASSGTATDSSPPVAESQGPSVGSLMDQATTAFKSGDYATAQQRCEEALKLQPKDSNLQQFHALCQFALGQYKDASASLHAALMAGPGWAWKTVYLCYGNLDTYTAHLRALEQYVKENPTSADARFVLTVNYLVIKQPQAAAGQLRELVKLDPTDKLAAAMLRALQ